MDTLYGQPHKRMHEDGMMYGQPHNPTPLRPGRSCPVLPCEHLRPLIPAHHANRTCSPSPSPSPLPGRASIPHTRNAFTHTRCTYTHMHVSLSRMYPHASRVSLSRVCVRSFPYPHGTHAPLVRTSVQHLSVRARVKDIRRCEGVLRVFMSFWGCYRLALGAVLRHFFISQALDKRKWVRYTSNISNGDTQQRGWYGKRVFP